MQVTLIGVDLAKSIFQVCGVNQAGKAVFNKTVKRSQLMSMLLSYPEATIAMEACSGSNYWGRELKALGFEVRLLPPQHVKPFVKGNKNDRNDAFAITEAARRPNLRYVEPRTIAQTELIQVHRLRQRKVEERTALTNQVRGFLNEYGLVVAAGKGHLYRQLPILLADTHNGLSVSARELLQWIYTEWQGVNEAIAKWDKAIEQQAKQSDDAKRLMSIKGIAEKTSTAIIAHAGNGSGYQSGRHFAANMGLVPKEHSSGGKQSLGGITKRGNRYLRRLLVQGAWSVLRYVDKNDDRLSRWAKQIMDRRGKHKAALAVTNKLARIAWSVLYHKTEYRAM